MIFKAAASGSLICQWCDLLYQIETAPDIIDGISNNETLTCLKTRFLVIKMVSGILYSP